MDTETIEKLASGPKESLADLNTRMLELKAQGAGILLCVIYVRKNQQCGLSEAAEIVINSDAWIDQKDDFLQQQEEALQEFIGENRNKIESIQQTFTPDGTQTTINMKQNESH